MLTELISDETLLGETLTPVMFVSSAKRKISVFLQQDGRSLIYVIKSTGPNTDPCGTPQVVSRQGDEPSCISTFCNLCKR